MLPLRGRTTNDLMKDHWVDSDHPHSSIHTADLRSHIAKDVSLPNIRLPSQAGLTVFFLRRTVASWHNDDRENGDQQQSFRIKSVINWVLFRYNFSGFDYYPISSR
jgi:hypothetical protein